MNASQISRTTGISPKTVLRHLEKGKLHGWFWNGHWYVSENECYCWALRCWREGRCLMYPIPRIKRGLAKPERFPY